MSRTTGRTLELLALLQSRREWSGTELRERLEVSDRTLRRDIDDLRELGYGIEATRGRHGGYRLGAGAALPPLTLSADESVAIAVGLRAAANGVVTGIDEASARALSKLEQSLSAATRKQIEDVERAMVPLPSSRDDVDVSVVTAAARAIAERRRIRIDYRRHDGEEVRRIVEPHRMVHTDTRWYLVAWDPDRAAWRTLRADRIRHPVVLREGFPSREIPDDALREFTTRSITTSPYPVHARLRMHAPPDDVRRHFDAAVAQVADAGDGTSILTAGSRTPEEFALHVGLAGIDFDVIDGEEVRQALVALAARFTRAAGAGSTAAARAAPGTGAEATP